MSLLATLATCMAMAGPVSVECVETQEQYAIQVSQLSITEIERDAIARVTFAEAANQGDAGLAAVVYTIINRTISGQFGSTIESVLNAKNQFEPVMRAGGTWQKLPKVKTEHQAKIDTILNLALTGYLPDLTRGALFFQNPDIVQKREEKGTVSKGLTHFGGATPAVVIKDHAFYQQIGSAKPKVAAQLSVSLSTRKSRRAEERRLYLANYTGWGSEVQDGQPSDD